MSNKLQKNTRTVAQAMTQGVQTVTILIDDFAALDIICTRINTCALCAGLLDNKHQRRVMIQAIIFEKNAEGLDRLAELTAHFNQLLRDVGAIDMDLTAMTFNRLHPLLDKYSRALMSFSSGEDNGESLWELARSGETTAAIAEMKASIRSAGRPTEPMPDLARDLVRQLQTSLGNRAWSNIGIQIRADLAKKGATRTAPENELYHYLEGKTKQRMAQYFRQLFE